MPRRLPLVVVTAAYLAAVGWATLGPVSWHAIGWEARFGILTPSIWLDPATWTTGSLTEFAMNVAMFAPLGALFAMLAGARRWFGAFAAAVGVSVVIELVQIPLDDRISDPRDLLANTAGAAVGIVGVGVARLARAIAHRIRTLELPRTEAAAEPDLVRAGR